MPATGIYNLADTWNQANTVFSAIKMNVTDAASASGSKLLDLLVGGSSKFSVGKTGDLSVSGATTLTGALSLGTSSSLTPTWNNIGTTFIATTINVTDTASAAGSKFIDYQIGGSTRFSVGKDGSFTASGGATLSSTLSLSGAATFSNTLNVTGATSLSSTLSVSGDTTISHLKFTTNNVSDIGTSASKPRTIYVGTGIVARSSNTTPTTTDIPASQYTLWKNTFDASVKLYYNDAGTLKSVALA